MNSPVTRHCGSKGVWLLSKVVDHLILCCIHSWYSAQRMISVRGLLITARGQPEEFSKFTNVVDCECFHVRRLKEKRWRNEARRPRRRRQLLTRRRPISARSVFPISRSSFKRDHKTDYSVMSRSCFLGFMFRDDKLRRHFALGQSGSSLVRRPVP